MIDLTYIARMAPIWRARRPSGRFVRHRLPCDRFCHKHGPVTRFHFCQHNCVVSEFKCLPGCSRAECERPGVAK